MSVHMKDVEEGDTLVQRDGEELVVEETIFNKGELTYAYKIKFKEGSDLLEDEADYTSNGSWSSHEDEHPYDIIEIRKKQAPEITAQPKEIGAFPLDSLEKIIDSPEEADALPNILDQSPVILELIEKIKARDREGFKTFGGSLDDKSMDVTGWLEEAIEETIDLLAYLMRAKQELQKKLENHKTGGLLAAVILLNREIDKLGD